MKTIPCKLVSILVLCCWQPVLADTLKIPLGTQTAERSNITRPTMGMSKTLVKSQFGIPLKENPAKGNPPISSWEYKDFSVYFEHEHVIHSVVKAKKHEATETVIEETVEMKEEDLKLK